jgi:hypothetical protein
VTIERITTVAVEAAVTVLSETIDSVVASEKVTRQTNEWKTRGRGRKDWHVLEIRESDRSLTICRHNVHILST